MAELLPCSNELRTCLIETINGQGYRNDNNPEVQRIYAFFTRQSPPITIGTKSRKLTQHWPGAALIKGSEISL